MLHGMYMHASNNKRAQHCMYSVVDKSVDNFYSGYCVVVDNLVVCCG